MTKSTRSAEEQIPDYFSYLLRLWRMEGQGEANWRASLTSPGSGEPHGFASLEDLFRFLRRQIGAGAKPEDANDTRQ